MAHYLKLLLLSLAIVSLMGFTWAVTMGVGPFHGLRIASSQGANVIIGLSILLVSGIGYLFVNNGNIKSILAGIAFGALCGTFTAFCVWIGDVIADSHGGFWLGLFYWFICLIGVTACCCGMFMAVKTGIIAAVHLDFFLVLVCIIVAVSAFFSGMSFFINAFQYHFLVGLGVIIGIVGGGAASVKAPGIESPIAMGSDGNIHFIASRNSNNEITDTDGNRMRQMPDGTYQHF